MVLAACIVEGCTYPYETGATADVPFELDAGHPVATSLIDIELSDFALPGDVEERGARVKLTLVGAPDVVLTLVPQTTGEAVPIVSSQGVASLPLTHCRPDEPCTVRALAVVEWLHPQAGTAIDARLTVEGLVRVPHTEKKCGLPTNVVTVTASSPVALPPAAGDGVGEARHDVRELVRHVTIRVAPGLEASTADEPRAVRGHLAITPDPEPPGIGAAATLVPGMWLRVTPDDGGTPVLDAPVPTSYPPLPADATFPIDAACEVRCERGYWIQAAVYDPAGRSSVDIANAIFGWAFDASVSSAVETGASVQVTLDAEDGREPPPSLILRGTGDPFRIGADQRAETLVIDAQVPERDGTPLGDRIADVPIVFHLTTFNVGGPGQPWLSNGHYLGDGSTGDDVADTGATGGPVTVSSPAGRPFAACAGVAQACAARTGLVQRYYHTSFDHTDTTPPYDVRWEWSVVGAPPGATVTVRPIAGETLGDSIGPVSGPLLVATLLAGGTLLALVAIGAIRRRRAPADPHADTQGIVDP